MDGAADASLITAVGGELSAMAADLLRLQEALSAAFCDGGDLGKASGDLLATTSADLPGRAAGPGIVIALQDLDRLTQTAAELGRLCVAAGRAGPAGDGDAPARNGGPAAGIHAALAGVTMHSLGARLSDRLGAVPTDPPSVTLDSVPNATDRDAPGVLHLFD